jgi:hypothetical protein
LLACHTAYLVTYGYTECRNANPLDDVGGDSLAEIGRAIRKAMFAPTVTTNVYKASIG